VTAPRSPTSRVAASTSTWAVAGGRLQWHHLLAYEPLALRRSRSAEQFSRRHPSVRLSDLKHDAAAPKPRASCQEPLLHRATRAIRRRSNSSAFASQGISRFEVTISPTTMVGGDPSVKIARMLKALRTFTIRARCMYDITVTPEGSPTPTYSAAVT